MCLYPRLIQNRKYIANKKNGGVIPPLPLGKDGKEDKRVLSVAVGCGRCMECRKQKKHNWQVRLSEEIKEKRNGVFVTLTFSNEAIKNLGRKTKTKGYKRDNDIATIAVRYFLERWRQNTKKV